MTSTCASQASTTNHCQSMVVMRVWSNPALEHMAERVLLEENPQFKLQVLIEENSTILLNHTSTRAQTKRPRSSWSHWTRTMRRGCMQSRRQTTRCWSTCASTGTTKTNVLDLLLSLLPSERAHRTEVRCVCEHLRERAPKRRDASGQYRKQGAGQDGKGAV